MERQYTTERFGELNLCDKCKQTIDIELLVSNPSGSTWCIHSWSEMKLKYKKKKLK